MDETNRIMWYIKRLSRMCPAEIIYRIVNVIINLQERACQRLKLVKTFHLRDFGDFFLTEKDIDLLREFYGKNIDQENKLINRGEKLLAHKYSFFALKDKYFGEIINWHKDYSNDVEENGDIKYIWELNRFQNLFTLAQTYCVTGENKYAEEIVNQIDDWIDKNPYLTGINWTRPLEMSLRIISWGWALHILRISGYKFSDSFFQKLGNSVALQAEYTKRHFSGYSSANNHLIGEAAGLVAAGCMFDFGNISGKWARKGHAILKKELEKQFSEEGLNREQAISYHCFTYDFYLLSFLLLRNKDYFDKTFFSKKMKKMAEVLLQLTDKNLNYFNFGDSDDGYVLKIDTESLKDSIVSILNTSAILFKSPKYDFLPKNPDLKTLWLTGANGYKVYRELEPQKYEISSAFLNDSGYFLFNTENIKALMDTGPLGYLSIAAHGHADTLSFCLNYNNKEFLIDSGTYCYNKDEKLRNYFKGTAAHNTITVDGKNQSQIGGNFLWLKKADTKVEKVLITQEQDYVKAFHNGFIKQGTGVLHTREAIYKKKQNQFYIIDHVNITDKKEHKIDLYWHLHPDCEVEQDENVFKIINADSAITMNILLDRIYSFNIIEGPVSKSFDQKKKTKIIQARCITDKNTRFITFVCFW